MKYILLVSFISWNAWAGPGINFQLLKGYQSQSLGQKSGGLRELSQNEKSLIQSQLNPLKNSEPVQNWDRQTERSKLYSEGTGTRGGGSGVLTTFPNGDIKIQLLDIYRSSRRDLFPLFFETDPGLIQISVSQDAESAANQIFSIVIGRAEKVFPVLAQKISSAAQAMPMEKWVPTFADLPLIDDYIGNAGLEKDQAQVQIAYRRNNQVIYNEKLVVGMDGLNRAALRLHEYIYAVSGQKTSVQTQRLVSLLMSSKILSPGIMDIAKPILFDLKLDAVDMKILQLPEGAEITENRPGLLDVCGSLNKMFVDPKKGEVRVQLKVDPDHLRIDRRDLSPRKLLSMNFSKMTDVNLKGDELKKFMLSLYFAKSYLEGKYPIFLYPAQSIPADIVCINRLSGRLSSIDISVRYHKEKNEADIESSRLEAEYFKAHRKMVIEPSVLSEFKFQNSEFELKMQNLKTQYLEGETSLEKWGLMTESQELGGLRIKFSN